MIRFTIGRNGKIKEQQTSVTKKEEKVKKSAVSGSEASFTTPLSSSSHIGPDSTYTLETKSSLESSNFVSEPYLKDDYAQTTQTRSIGNSKTDSNKTLKSSVSNSTFALNAVNKNNINRVIASPLHDTPSVPLSASRKTDAGNSMPSLKPMGAQQYKNSGRRATIANVQISSNTSVNNNRRSSTKLSSSNAAPLSSSQKKQSQHASHKEIYQKTEEYSSDDDDDRFIFELRKRENSQGSSSSTISQKRRSNYASELGINEIIYEEDNEANNGFGKDVNRIVGDEKEVVYKTIQDGEYIDNEEIFSFPSALPEFTGNQTRNIGSLRAEDSKIKKALEHQRINNIHKSKIPTHLSHGKSLQSEKICDYEIKLRFPAENDESDIDKKLNPLPFSELQKTFHSIVEQELSAASPHQERILARFSALLYAYLKATTESDSLQEKKPSLTFLIELTDKLIEVCDSSKSVNPKHQEKFLNQLRLREEVLQSIHKSQKNLKEENAILTQLINKKNGHSKSLPSLQNLKSVSSIHVSLVRVQPEDANLFEDATVLLKVDQETQLSKSEIDPGTDQSCGANIPFSITHQECQTDPQLDDRLMKAEIKVELLSEQLQKQETDYKTKLNETEKDLKSELLELKEKFETKESSWREEKHRLVNDTKTLQEMKQKLKEITSQTDNLKDINEKLNVKIQELENALQEKQNQLKETIQEKMDTFKQFRQLNKLYDELREQQEMSQNTNSAVSQEMKNMSEECEQLRKQMIDKEKLYNKELDTRKQLTLDFIRMKQELSELEKKNQLLLNNDKESSKKMAHFSNKIKELQENINGIMKFPDISMNEVEYHLSTTSPQFDQTVQHYIQANNIRIFLLEKKNKEYREMRKQHAQIFAKANSIPFNHRDQLGEQNHEETMRKIDQLNDPKRLWNVQSIKETIHLLKASASNSSLPDLNQIQVAYKKLPPPSIYSSLPELSANSPSYASLNEHQGQQLHQYAHENSMNSRPIRSALSAGKSRKGLSTPKTVRWEEF